VAGRPYGWSWALRGVALCSQVRVSPVRVRLVSPGGEPAGSVRLSNVCRPVLSLAWICSTVQLQLLPFVSWPCWVAWTALTASVPSTSRSMSHEVPVTYRQPVDSPPRASTDGSQGVAVVVDRSQAVRRSNTLTKPPWPPYLA
jgi:hypothetical protein